MGMTIDEAEQYLIALKHCETCESNDANDCKACEYHQKGSSAKCYDAIDIGIATMRKYQMFQADYEARLKADLVAMLEEISLEIEEKTKDTTLDDYDCGFNTGIYVSRDIIQQKIDKLKEVEQ